LGQKVLHNSLPVQNKNNIQFCDFCGYKFFAPLSFVAVVGSGIRNSGGIKIRIRDKHPGSATLLVTKGNNQINKLPVGPRPSD
jgi:hypothetical protein